MKDTLRSIDLGSSVAEFDESLEKYFVENEAFYALISGQADIVAGDKGTGKTALFRILQKRYGSMDELKGVEVVAGFNPAGSPIFQRLVKEQVLSEGQYVSVWKTYLLALMGNWAIEIAGEDYSSRFRKLTDMLVETGLRSKDDKPETVFSKIANSISRAIKPKTAEVQFAFSETGLPIITPKMTFESGASEAKPAEVSHEEALALLNECLRDLDYKVWLALDRLDEAFQGFPLIEVPALRALLRTYLDLLAFDNFRLKLFVRRDLFKRIIGDGFVNLTHLNARKIEIVWDEADLLNLLCRRVRDSASAIKALGAEGLSDEQLFYKLFPGKVDAASRKPTSWKWIMARIRDGNEVKPPRNLIDLAKMAREEQLKAETRNPRPFSTSEPLIQAESIRKALERLSAQRVEDTLLAEAGAETAALIHKFRRAKAEQNLDSLSIVLGLTGELLDHAIQQLCEVGFLEKGTTSWKVPMLYRDGLDVTQGKGFPSEAADADDSE